jgi:osmoprotectant transport system permease protein
MILFDWILDPTHWTGPGGVPVQVGYHLLYSAIALVIAAAIGVPLGVYVGYTGRGEAVVAGLANSLRALPTLGLLVLVYMLIAPVVLGKLVFIAPAIIVLVLLAIPSILTGTYSGIQAVDVDAVGAARGMGYTKRQILWHVQLPCALPLLLSGIRSSTLQIVSTATVAAYLGLQGLGRYILDGRAQGDYGQMAAGALLVALLALILEFAFVGLSRLVVSPGLLRVARVSRKAPRVGDVSVAVPQT